MIHSTTGLGQDIRQREGPVSGLMMPPLATVTLPDTVPNPGQCPG